jgi:hypothetical protein
VSGSRVAAGPGRPPGLPRPSGGCRAGDSRKPQWLITCSCGWTREAISEWAAKSISKIHPRIGLPDGAHVTRVEGPDDGGS